MASHGELFWSFFKIGSFTIGGGYAMIPLMEQEVVSSKKWLCKEDFLDVLSVSQAMPGIFAVNMATNIGYRLCGITGAISAVIGNIIVPIIMILALAMFFRFFSSNHLVESIFMGIRPAVVALIAAPVFSMAKTAKVNWRNVWIPAVAAFLIWFWGISPVLIIFAAIVGGFLYGRVCGRKEVQQ